MDYALCYGCSEKVIMRLMMYDVIISENENDVDLWMKDGTK